MNYVCHFQNPKEKDRNSKWCALNGDLEVTWCSLPVLPREVSPKGKEYWHQRTGSLRDALGQKNSLPECCSSRKGEGKKSLLHINYTAKRQRVSKKVTDYLNCDKIKGERWFHISSGSKMAPCIAEHHWLPKYNLQFPRKPYRNSVIVPNCSLCLTLPGKPKLCCI